MKKFYMTMVAMLCGVAAMAQEGLYFEDIAIDKNETEAEMSVCLRAAADMNVTAVSFVIAFPEGVSVPLYYNEETEAYEPDADDFSVPRARKNGHTAMVGQKPNGDVQVNIFTTTVKAFKGEDGAIVTFPIEISQEVAAKDATLPVKIYEISISNTNSESLTLAGLFPTEFEGTLIIGEGTGINTIKADDVNAPIYNVAGQRVSKAQKGVFIQNGKKVAVK